jgi:hypothetical protein
MPTSALIGLAVTSHSAGAMTTAVFSNVTAAGGVTGAWQVEAIGVAQPSNAAAPLYVTVEDSAGKSKTVAHPDPAATTLATWQPWRIPLSEFSGVNLSRVETLILGVGSRTQPTPGGAGILYVDDIGVGHPANP